MPTLGHPASTPPAPARAARPRSPLTVPCGATVPHAHGTTAIKNVAFDWKEPTAKTGELVITYDTAEIPHELLGHAWRGVFLVVRDLIGAELQLEKSVPLAPNALHMHFSW